MISLREMSSVPYKKDNDNLLIFDGRWQLSQHFINLSISCFPNPPKRQWGLFFAWRKWPMIYWQSSRVLPIMAAPSRISTRWSRHANWTALLISITLISAMCWGHRFWKWDGRSEGNRTLWSGDASPEKVIRWGIGRDRGIAKIIEHTKNAVF